MPHTSAIPAQKAPRRRLPTPPTPGHPIGPRSERSRSLPKKPSKAHGGPIKPRSNRPRSLPTPKKYRPDSQIEKLTLRLQKQQDQVTKSGREVKALMVEAEKREKHISLLQETILSFQEVTDDGSEVDKLKTENTRLLEEVTRLKRQIHPLEWDMKRFSEVEQVYLLKEVIPYKGFMGREIAIAHVNQKEEPLLLRLGSQGHCLTALGRCLTVGEAGGEAEVGPQHFLIDGVSTLTYNRIKNELIVVWVHPDKKTETTTRMILASSPNFSSLKGGDQPCMCSIVAKEEEKIRKSDIECDPVFQEYLGDIEKDWSRFVGHIGKIPEEQLTGYDQGFMLSHYSMFASIQLERRGVEDSMKKVLGRFKEQLEFNIGLHKSKKDSDAKVKECFTYIKNNIKEGPVVLSLGYKDHSIGLILYTSTSSSQGLETFCRVIDIGPGSDTFGKADASHTNLTKYKLGINFEGTYKKGVGVCAGLKAFLQLTDYKTAEDSAIAIPVIKSIVRKSGFWKGMKMSEVETTKTRIQVYGYCTSESILNLLVEMCREMGNTDAREMVVKYFEVPFIRELLVQCLKRALDKEKPTKASERKRKLRASSRKFREQNLALAHHLRTQIEQLEEIYVKVSGGRG